MRSEISGKYSTASALMDGRIAAPESHAFSQPKNV